MFIFFHIENHSELVTFYALLKNLKMHRNLKNPVWACGQSLKNIKIKKYFNIFFQLLKYWFIFYLIYNWWFKPSMYYALLNHCNVSLKS